MFNDDSALGLFGFFVGHDYSCLLSFVLKNLFKKGFLGFSKNSALMFGLSDLIGLLPPFGFNALFSDLLHLFEIQVVVLNFGLEPFFPHLDVVRLNFLLPLLGQLLLYVVVYCPDLGGNHLFVVLQLD